MNLTFVDVRENFVEAAYVLIVKSLYSVSIWSFQGMFCSSVLHLSTIENACALCLL